MSAMLLPVATTRSRVRNRIYAAPRRNEVLDLLYEAPDRKASTKDLGVSFQYMDTLENPEVGAALVKRVGKAPSGPKGGRPAVVWTLTDAGVKRIRRARGEIK